MNFGERLKRIRALQGLSQEEFAKQIGITRSPIASAEANKSKLHPLTIQKICELYDVNENWLTSGEGQMQNNYDIPPEELKSLLETYSKLEASSRKKFVDLLEELTKSN